MNLFIKWAHEFNVLSNFAKTSFWRKSINEEKTRYLRCPCEGAYSNSLYNWQMWRQAGCRLPDEQDVKGYD